MLTGTHNRSNQAYANTSEGIASAKMTFDLAERLDK